MQRVVINKCFGGFGLSDAAYEKLIEWGVPLRVYVEEERDPETGRYRPQPSNNGEVIFDRTHETSDLSGAMIRLSGRYWDTWTRDNRTHPLVVRVVQELGSKAASGRHAELAVVEIPDGVEFTVEEYDGSEHVAEKHRTWS